MRQLQQNEIEQVSGGFIDPISISLEIGIPLLIATIGITAKLIQMYYFSD